MKRLSWQAFASNSSAASFKRSSMFTFPAVSSSAWQRIGGENTNVQYYIPSAKTGLATYVGSNGSKSKRDICVEFNTFWKEFLH